MTALIPKILLIPSMGLILLNLGARASTEKTNPPKAPAERAAIRKVKMNIGIRIMKLSAARDPNMPNEFSSVKIIRLSKIKPDANNSAIFLMK